MKKSGEKIRVRILIPLVVALIIMLTASLFSSYRLQQYHLDTDMQFRRSNLERLFNDLVEKEAKTLQTYIKVIGENRQLREAWLRGNRDEVRSKALTFFEELNTQAGVTHFYFINSERICFLRMHHPSRFGDIINRVTLDRAVFSREVSNGLELGTMGTFTLRVVMPWIINGQMNGYIELGKEIENIKLDLENLFGVRLIFAIEKKYVDRRGWESGMKMLGRSLDWNEFSDFVVTMENPEDLSPKIEEHIRTFLLGREDDVSFRDGDKRLMVGSIPLQDVRRRTVGEMFVVYDVTESVSNLRHINKLLVGLSFLLGSGVFFLFYFYIGRIEDKLGLSFNELTREIAERRRAESLLEDAREHLESEVARRTEELKTTNSALVQEVEERLRAEEALKLDEERLEALLELSQREWKTKDDLTNYALEEGVRLNKSTMGYLHFFREDWNELELFTWNQPELSSDSKVENVSCPLEKQSIWRECAQQGKPIIFNNYQEEAENLGETGGVNLPLVRLMSVPVFEGRELIAVAGVGNKQEFYDQNDVRQLTLYMSSMLKILQTKKTEESLRNSEEKYRRLFGEALDAIMVTDAETGVLVDCNHTATVLTGRSRKELLTMHQSDLYDVGEKKVRSVVFLPRTWSGKMEEDFLEVSIRTKKGELREVTIKSNIFEYQGKKLVQSIIRDVTSQKHALEKLERSEKKFRQLFDSASDAIFIHNLQGRFLEVNDAACTRLGYTREELYTMTPYNLDHPDESVKVNERIRILLKQGYNLFETFHVTKKQQVIPTEVSSRVIDFEGERAVLSIARDITERKKYEAELLQARVEAEAANEAKSRFLANVSHEIRTPMNAIMGMGYLALQSNPSVVVQDYLNKIHSSAYSLLGIINDILDFSKIEAGRMDLETVSFTLDQVLTHVINLTGTKLKEKRLELVISISENVPQNLLGDPLRLGQILTNLVYNSIKFTDSGEIVISVYASELTSDHCKMNFSVRDTGIGMDQEQVKGIFQAFSQADASITRRFGGTGLGLAISKKLVEMMGGGMSIESELGIGSTFSFTSVLSISSDECTNIYDNVPNVSGMRALVIDDNSTAGDVLCKMFDHYGIKAELALSQEEGIRKLAKNESDWDLVFVDWNLGGESGHKVVSSIVRSVGAVQPPLLVMLTGFGYDGIKEAQKFGVEYFLAKPLLPS
ncbi:MAG: PAS domain S-box protein, partial [Desulfobulbaceae bacterium]|nr:PAS domain S-box protein [Desulfobulbaceae bacterium]